MQCYSTPRSVTRVFSTVIDYQDLKWDLLVRVSDPSMDNRGDTRGGIGSGGERYRFPEGLP